MRFTRPAVVLFSGLLAAVIFFRLSVATGFDVVQGDIWDGSLIMGFVDHWRMVFLGQREWTSLPMFWPEPDTLGYSDTFFLPGVLYSLLCFGGVDQYFAYTITFMLLAFAGCILMYLLLNRFLNVPWLLAAALGVLFVNLSPTQMIDMHFQMTLVWLCPGVVMLGWSALSGGRRAWIWAAACAALLSVMFFTAFYVPWFMTLFVCISVLVWALPALAAIRLRTMPRLAERQAGQIELNLSLNFSTLLGKIRTILSHKRALIAFVALFLVGIIPFLIVYLPALRESGGISYRSIKTMLPTALDYVNIEPALYLWGGLMSWLHIHTHDYGGELHFGLPPLTMLTFVTAFGFFIYWKLKGRTKSLEVNLALFAGICVVACWLLMLKVDNVSAWRIVHYLVPGGKAVRAVFRFNIVLSFFALVAIAVFLKELLARKGRVATAAVCVLVPLLLCEQIAARQTQSQISRTESIQFLHSLPQPPADARVFYLKTSSHDPVWTQITAFRIAQYFNLNTINGFSGFNPRQWKLDDTTSALYDMTAITWLADRMPDGFYRFDLDSMQWTTYEKILAGRPMPYRLGEDIIATNTFSLRDGGGWSGIEDGCVKSTQKRATIVLDLPRPSKGPLMIDMALEGYVSADVPLQRIRLSVNDIGFSNLDLRAGSNIQKLHIELPWECTTAQKLVFTFDMPDATGTPPVGICLREFSVSARKR
jgi:hypothetical protein